MKKLIIENFFTALLFCGCLLLGAFTIHYKTQAQKCELTAEQIQDLENLREQVRKDNLVIDSLRNEIVEAEASKTPIKDNIETIKDEKTKELERLRNAGPAERDQFWADYFTRKDSISWGQLDSLQY